MATNSIQRAKAEIELRRRRRDKIESAPVMPCAEWITKYVTIIDVQEDRSETVIPFTLWDAQVIALDILDCDENVQILKARQMGLTWLVLARWLWRMVHETNRLFFALSIKLDDSKDLVTRLRGMFERLPEEAKRGLVVETNNTQKFSLSNGSSIVAFPQSPTAGSSYTATEVLLDEYAKMRYDVEIQASVSATARDGSSRVIYLSTGYGNANTFYKLWMEEKIKRRIFLPWHSRPSRNAEWYEKEIGEAPDEDIFRREYPSAPEEAFSKVGIEHAFLSNIALWDRLVETIPALSSRDIIYLALDAGVTRDAFGLVACSIHPTRDGVVAVRYARCWLPERDEKGNLIREVPFAEVEAEVVRLSAICTIAKVYFDRSQLFHMAQRLRGRGIPCEEFSQHGLRLIADQALRDAIISGTIAHSGEVDLAAHIDNANAKIDDEGTKIRIVKRKADGSMPNDLAVALSMAHHPTKLAAEKMGTRDKSYVMPRPQMSFGVVEERTGRGLPPTVGFGNGR